MKSDHIRVSADWNDRQVSLQHSSPLEPIQSTLWTFSQQTVAIVNPADDEAVDHRPCYVKWQQFQ